MNFFKRNKAKKATFVDRRINNPQLDAHAIAKGLKRRRDDKVNDIFYFGIIIFLLSILIFFVIGSFIIDQGVNV